MRDELAEVRARYEVPDVLLPIVDCGLAFATLEGTLPEGWRFWGVRRASTGPEAVPPGGDESRSWAAACADTAGLETAFAFGPTGTDAVWGLVDRLRARP